MRNEKIRFAVFQIHLAVGQKLKEHRENICFPELEGDFVEGREGGGLWEREGREDPDGGKGK